MRRIALLALALAVVLTPAALAKPFPKTISLPNAWLPEGIATKGNTFYAGSRANGAVYAGDLRTGQGSILVPGVAGRVATGLKESHGMLFVSGAGTGKAWVFDAKTGAQLREYQLVAAGTSSFINDVIVTKDAAWFTDSRDDVLYRVALGKGHQPATTATQVQLTGDFQLGAAGQFNLNGIEAAKNGKTLLAIQSFNGKLYAIDAETGAAKLVDVGGADLTNGDGILLHGHTLYVVRNTNNQIAVLNLSHDFTSGKLVRTITDPGFDVPTTIAERGNRLYAVNARFSTPPTPSTTYTIVQVNR